MYALSIKSNVLWAFLILSACWLCASATIFAQGIIIDPPPIVEPLPSWQGPIQIERHQVDVIIDGPVANVHLTQIFRNDSGRVVEGVYVFPLPEDAAISDFQMTVDGQVLEGKILPKEEARRVYEEIVRQQRDPALLEYIGRDLFQASIFPIPPGASRKLELNYSQVVPLQNGLYRFEYPVRTRQYSASPVETLSINVELRNQPGLRTIYSPVYAVSVDPQSDDSAKVHYETTNTQPESDFALFFGVNPNDVGVNVISYKPAGEDGFFVLLAAPGLEIEASQIVHRDVIMVMDISGSMQGEKMEQARQAAHFVVDHLNPEDNFNLISFSTGVHLWQSGLQPVGNQQIKDAHAWIDRLQATGGTDINRAVLEALAQLEESKSEHPAYILFLTDGLPTQGETDIERIIRNALNNRPRASALRLFTFGVGFDVNTTLLDALSQELGGRSSYVRPDERINEEVEDFYSGISTPVLSKVALDFGKSVVIDEVYPYPLSDLFAGEQLVVTGRYHGGDKLDLTLRGEVNGQKLIYRYPGQNFVRAGGEPFVARLWATRKIGALLEDVRRNGPKQELIDAIVDLSLQYGIVTPYTSYLVLEPNLITQDGQAPRPQEDRNSAGLDGQTANRPEGGGAEPKAVREYAEKAVAEEIQTLSAAEVGADAVGYSETNNALAQAVNLNQNQTVRYVGGRSFVAQGMVTKNEQNQWLTLWVDTEYNKNMRVETVNFGSNCYFALVTQPQFAAFLAISPELIVVLDEKTAIRITTAQNQETKLCLDWQKGN